MGRSQAFVQFHVNGVVGYGAVHRPGGGGGGLIEGAPTKEETKLQRDAFGCIWRVLQLLCICIFARREEEIHSHDNDHRYAKRNERTNERDFTGASSYGAAFFPLADTEPDET